MTESTDAIITLLEQRKTAIEKALTALREVGEVAAPAQATPASTVTVETSGQKGKTRSAAVRKRMQEAQRARWAKIKGESEPPAPVTKDTPKPKRKIGAEGIKRIIAATKKRWRLKRAADKTALEQAEAKKAARKKTVAPAKAVEKTAPVEKAAVKKAASVKTVAKKKSAAAKRAPAPVPAVPVETSTEQV